METKKTLKEEYLADKEAKKREIVEYILGLDFEKEFREALYYGEKYIEDAHASITEDDEKKLRNHIGKIPYGFKLLEEVVNEKLINNYSEDDYFSKYVTYEDVARLVKEWFEKKKKFIEEDKHDIASSLYDGGWRAEEKEAKKREIIELILGLDFEKRFREVLYYREDLEGAYALITEDDEWWLERYIEKIPYGYKLLEEIVNEKLINNYSEDDYFSKYVTYEDIAYLVEQWLKKREKFTEESRYDIAGRLYDGGWRIEDEDELQSEEKEAKKREIIELILGLDFEKEFRIALCRAKEYIEDAHASITEDDEQWLERYIEKIPYGYKLLDEIVSEELINDYSEDDYFSKYVTYENIARLVEEWLKKKEKITERYRYDVAANLKEGGWCSEDEDELQYEHNLTDWETQVIVKTLAELEDEEDEEAINAFIDKSFVCNQEP